ncbi:unnamed protein product [Rotaria magnacalcarata]
MCSRKSIPTAITSDDDRNAVVAKDEQIRQHLCSVNDLHNGQMKEFEIKTVLVTTSILLIRQNDKFYAYSSKCCHYKLPLVKGSLINNHLRCFAHGACFRVDTGDIEDHPGHGHLPKYDVEIVDNQIPDNLVIEAKPVVAIVGAGAGKNFYNDSSGFTCADMLRQNGFRGRIILFSSEATLPYDRVQLSKQPAKNPQDLFLRDETYFQKAHIDLLLHTEVTNINWSDKSLTYKPLDKRAKSQAYDYLVLATGLRPRKLPTTLPVHNLSNIFYLRSLDDAGYLATTVKSPDTKNIVIIGDSFIALELCGWLTTGLNEKKTVSVVMRSKIPMARIFGQRIGQALQKIHEKNGAIFYPQANVTKLTGENNRIKFVQLEVGDLIPCDLLIVAIGSEICSELYKNSPIEMTNDGFIKVNKRLETSVERVLAVGDISKYPLAIFNLDYVNCQHWQMACSTGHQAANTILNNYHGQTAATSDSLKTDLYTTPIFWSTQNNKTNIRYAGYTRDPENVIIHGDLDDEFKFVAYYIVDGFVRAVAQSKYEPLTSEVAEVFYYKKNIRKEDVENDIYGYRKYLDFKTRRPE